MCHNEDMRYLTAFVLLLIVITLGLQFFRIHIIGNTANMVLKTIGYSSIPSFAKDSYALQSQINDLIEEQNYCTAATDCVLERFGCPFGEYRAINKNADLKQVENGLDRYESRADACVYEFPAYVDPDAITCHQFKCVTN